MKNTQGVWTLYGVMLNLKYLNVDKQHTAAERRRIVKQTDKLDQPRYCRNVTTLKWKTKYALHWERDCASVSTGNERLWIPSRLVMVSFGQGKPLKVLTTDINK